MLTKTDLNQIKAIVRGEIKDEIKPLKADVGTLKADVGTLKAESKKTNKRLDSIEKEIRSIRKNINEIIEFFDHEYLGLDARVGRLEKFVNIPPLIS